MTRDCKIAVFRALQLGDLLVAVPALRALRAGFPEAEITLISLPWAAEFARRFGHYVDRHVSFPGFPGMIEGDPMSGRTAPFVAEQRAYGYDLVIQLHGSGSVSNIIARELGGRRTAGYYAGQQPNWLDIAAPYPDGPEILRNLDLVGLIGCPDMGSDLAFPLYQEDRREAISLLGGHGRPLIGLHPGTRSPARRWPAGSFAAAASEIQSRHGGTVVLTGNGDEVALVESVARRIDGPVLNLAGRTSLGGLAAVIASLDLFISNSTGPAHIADAVVTPSIIVWGSVDPVRWGPLDRTLHRVVQHPVPCFPCEHWVCPIDHPCLRLLDPERVVAAAEDFLTTGAKVCNA